MPRLLAAVFVAISLGSASALATEMPQEHPLWLAPIPDGGLRRLEAMPAVLTLPPGWSVGDAAVVVLARRAATADGAASLRAALLAEGAAVLELDPQRIATVGEEPLAWLRGALLSLRRTQGAGLLVAVGFDGAGSAALEAAQQAVAAAQLGEAEDGPVAAAALGRRTARFAAGSRPMPEEGWQLRAPLLCAMLAALPEDSAEAERDCLDALVPEARKRLVAG